MRTEDIYRKRDTGRKAGTQRHEKGLTFIRVRAWLAHALRVQDRLFLTHAGRTQRHEKGLTFIRVEDPLIYTSPFVVRVLRDVISLSTENDLMNR